MAKASFLRTVVFSKRALPVAIPIIVSLLAWGTSCRSVRIAEKSMAVASRTYLVVEPTLVPLTSPSFADLRLPNGKKFSGERYMIMVARRIGIQSSLFVEIRNSGIHEAEGVVLHYKLEYVPAPYKEVLMSVEGELDIAPIAPGQVVQRDFSHGTPQSDNASQPPNPGVEFVELFEADKMEVRASYYVSFSDPSSSTRMSSVYRGTYRFGGREIFRDFAGDATIRDTWPAVNGE